MHTPSVATLREGQRCRALGGRIPMDWVATFLRIAWQLCRGLGGNFPADWVAEFRGIRRCMSYNSEESLDIPQRHITGSSALNRLSLPKTLQSGRDQDAFN
jgi:hypothetical protein